MTDLNRRDFIRAVTAVGVAGAGLSTAVAADANAQSPRPRRKFTKCLSCGAIGVGADQREAIRLAHRFGFEAVEPSLDFLGQLSQGELQDLLEDMKSQEARLGRGGAPGGVSREATRHFRRA